MTSSFDSYRPEESGQRRGKRIKGEDATTPNTPAQDAMAGQRRRGSGADEGRREMSVVGDVQFDSYYGRPVVKAPPWRGPIAAYLFLGGLAGGSALLGYGAQLTGRDALRRNSRLIALAALGGGTAALIEDLGRPERFLHMMRTVKITSPMSLGTWILASFGTLSGVLGAIEVDRMTKERLPLGPLRPLVHGMEGAAGLGQAALAPVLASYTGALLGDTTVPTWSASRDHLSFVFVSSASLASGGAAMVTSPQAETGPARVMAAFGAVGDVVSMHLMKESMHPLEREPLEEGAAGQKLKWAERLAIAGGIGAVLSRRSKLLSVASGAALVASSVLTRYGVLEAGLESVKDPRRVIEPQKARLAARRAAGITDDSITTAG
ncbi:NrfD/PsrC family molybdoenzyme membrane anchor subunit [Brachybacterium sp. Marseille-Q7125]|uniref:NrfD/PsrC family molybdoenzyme membrane anchor subunit n=1 Tax=Brachybacterium sp. Marseille-Q7125 TaxID=2932815 RepID=UPI001FF24D99|nr:NrfD/PsrC family molybdoenzyme membrane anchor subunit [Brachybacterium sp. Marseille-Q7125]